MSMSPTPNQWWRTAVIYQVYPRSFADSNGDGYGDLPGIIGRLDHLVNLGVDALWLSPFYVSPQRDGGYDVTNYRDVDPLFGTLADADALIAACHARGLRVIFDLIPNHTSAQHPWFQEALASGPGSAARDRYIFRDGYQRADGSVDTQRAPNSWRSVLGDSAWTRLDGPQVDDTQGQWYLHLFDASQPDLNWDNPQVRAEFEDILRFWLERGVDGFRIDVAHGLVKAPGLPDYSERVEMAAASSVGHPQGDAAVVSRAGNGSVEDDAARNDAVGPHDIGDGGIGPAGTDADDGLPYGAAGSDAPSTPMFDQPGVHRIFRAWRAVMDAYDPPGTAEHDRHSRALVAEAWVDSPARLARYVRSDEMQQAFNFDFLCTRWDAAAYRAVISSSLEACGAVGAPATWVLSNHDVVRHSSRLGLKDAGSRPNGIYPWDPQPDEALGLQRARAATCFMLALPGSAYLYNGEELGLPEHTSLDNEFRQAPEFFRTGGAEAGRDGCRVPLPWEQDLPACGFSPTGASWLPQPGHWAKYAVDAQAGVPGSTLEMYREALRLRKAYQLGAGQLSWIEGLPDHLLAFHVCPPGQDSERGCVNVVTNISDQDYHLDLAKLPASHKEGKGAGTSVAGTSGAGTSGAAGTSVGGTSLAGTSGAECGASLTDVSLLMASGNQLRPDILPANTCLWLLGSL